MRALKLAIIFLLYCPLALSQHRQVTGRVTDAGTGEGIPFANVFIKGTAYGTGTDEDGYYLLQVPAVYDSIGAYSTGYRQMMVAVGKEPQQTINFTLIAEGVNLADLVVRASKESLEDYLWRNIQANKAHNSKSFLSSYEYEAYNKIEIDLKRLPDKMMERKVLKPFAEVLMSNLDTISEIEPFLPLLLTENISDVYYSREPRRQREIIKATKVSGMQDESMGQFLSSMYQEFSVYDNSITILGKEFISPLARTGKMFYDFKVVDTLILNNEVHYRMTFRPRTKGDALFSGNFLVSEKNFAIKDIHLSMPREVNINFIRRLEINQDFEWVQDTMWMLTREKIIIEFTPLERMPTVIGRKTVTYTNFLLNDPGTIRKIEQYKSDIVTLPGVLDKDEIYWTEARHTPLSHNEQAIYGLIDSIQSIKAYKTWSDILYLVLYGYVEAGPIDIGPISNFISTNSVEQVRFRVGGRTNDKLSEWVRLSAYIAYGIKDKRVKGGGEFKWLVKKSPFTVLGISYRHDVDYASYTTDPFGVDNIFSALYRRKIPEKLIFIDQGKLFWERDWNYGFNTRLTMQNRRFRPETFALDYLKPDPENGLDTIRNINQSEAILNLHWGFRERFLGSGFTRSSMGTKYPLIDMEYVLGFRKIFGSEYNYHKVSFLIRDEQPINPIGRLEYKFQVGKVFGKLPYMLLEIPNGNETFFLNSKSYNLMNSYEFFTDRWISLELTHHFDGFFLNRIPGVRKAKLREVIYFKAIWGNPNTANREANREGLAIPLNIRIPYIETGFGIENILKVFRLDFIWRATYRDNPDIVKWGIRLGTGFSF